ncbi:MAG: MucBP domain-containing protein [Lactobacillaceae bacterium]|jgi:hypothetical protein|nr:MucBP domain-containing protein [Lactobacillaceae bacterium]
MADMHLNGTPVWVYMKEQGTNKTIKMANLVEGEMGSQYKIEPETLPGYIVTNIDGDLEGTFDEGMHMVTVYYRKADVAQVEQLEEKFLHVVGTVDTYAEPDLQTEPMTYPLLAGSVWQVVARMATTKGIFWHQLADGRWVKYDRKQMSITDAAQVKLPTEKFDWTPMPFDANGTIDYVEDEAVAVYTQPYGSEVENIKHGTAIQIKEVVLDPSGVRWYLIADRGWVSSVYVKIEVL